MTFPPPRGAAAALAGLLLLPGLAACGGGDDTTVLRVFAAASLTSAFEELADAFEEEHQGVEVELNLAGSSDLVTQIQNGARADVFASADEPNMQRLVDDGLAGSEPDAFAANTLTIAVPPGNPAGINGLADLAAAEIDLVVCAPQVPCGAASVRAEDEAGLDWTPRSEEQSVTDVLNKVVSGQADAGLVYVTDVLGADGAVDSVDFPESAVTRNTYPIATVEGSDEEELARAFVELVRSERGSSVLTGAGFSLP